MQTMPQRFRVAILGSGNFGSVIAKIISKTVLQKPELFEPTVKMWVYEEMIQDKNKQPMKLTQYINTYHENIKYLPGIKIGSNVVAVPDAIETAKDANLFVFVLPHQFLPKLCKDLVGMFAKQSQPPRKIIGVSLIKGIEFDHDNAKPILISEYISHILPNIDMNVLMGANIASDVAQETFCEATIGCRNLESGHLLWELFNTPSYRCSVVQEVAGVELCGAIKNAVALAAGICDGLGLGMSTTAAFIRIGFVEQKKFIKLFYPNVNDDVFFESCGVADLLATCFGGRNRKVAREYAIQSLKPNKQDRKSLDQLEAELLNGQKLQGTLTAKDINLVLKSRNLESEFPLLTKLYRIFYEGEEPKSIVDIEHMASPSTSVDSLVKKLTSKL